MLRPSSSAPALLALLLVLATAPLAAESVTRLRDDFTTEARSLDLKIEQYFDARERENDALAELAQLSRQLDDTLADTHSGRTELINLDAQVTVARERACGRTEETAERRRDMFESMQRLAGMARELERLGISLSGESSGVSGSWQVQAQPNDVWGILDLRNEGSLVIGSYSLSNGAEGSTKGTFAGGRLELEMVDSQRGVVGVIRGELDPDSGDIHGTWEARDLAAGRPTAGEWTARRVALGE